MMRIRRPATANKTGLFDHVPDMAAVTNTARFREYKHAFELAGVEFIDEDGGGPGVRLRKRHQKRS
jgi:hypothetical protein